MPPPQKKRSGCLFWGCGGCLTLIVLGILVIGGIAYMTVNAMKNAEPYKSVVATTENSPKVQAALGAPVKAHFKLDKELVKDLKFDVHNDNGVQSGHAVFSLAVDGASKTGVMHYEGHIENGAWVADTFTVTPDGSTDVIDLK